MQGSSSKIEGGICDPQVLDRVPIFYVRQKNSQAVRINAKKYSNLEVSSRILG